VRGPNLPGLDPGEYAEFSGATPSPTLPTIDHASWSSFARPATEAQALSSLSSTGAVYFHGECVLRQSG
jgi:hypothetical protein